MNKHREKITLNSVSRHNHQNYFKILPPTFEGVLFFSNMKFRLSYTSCTSLKVLKACLECLLFANSLGEVQVAARSDCHDCHRGS